MCGIHWVISSATIISLLAKVSGDTSVETVPSMTGANVKLIVDILDPTKLPFNALQVEYHDVPCTCSSLTCSCCFGLNIVALNFDNTACIRATIVPEVFAIDFAVTASDLTIMNQRLSARDPPSICAPLPILPVLTFCLRAFDLGLINKRLHACIDLEAKLAGITIAVLHFNCIALGGEEVIAWEEPRVSTRVVNLRDTSSMESLEVYEVDRFEDVDDDPY